MSWKNMWMYLWIVYKSYDCAIHRRQLVYKERNARIKKKQRSETAKLNPIGRRYTRYYIFQFIDYKITHETVLMSMIEAVMCVKNAARFYYYFFMYAYVCAR